MEIVILVLCFSVRNVCKSGKYNFIRVFQFIKPLVVTGCSICGSGCADHGLQLQVRVLETGSLGELPHVQPNKG